MTNDSTPRLGLPYLVEAQAAAEDTIDQGLARLDHLVQTAVITRGLTAPPGSPDQGDVYIPAAGATGVWSGHDGKIAAWYGTSWEITAPWAGFLAYVTDEDAFLRHDGAAWGALGASGGVAIADVAGLSDALDDLAPTEIWGGTATGAANAPVIAPAVPPAGLAAGQHYWFIGAASNTGAATLQVGALAPAAVKQPSGADLVAGMIQSGFVQHVIFTGAHFVLLSSALTYEQGVFTPTLQAATPGTSAWTFVNADGQYTRIGNRVFFDFQLGATLDSLGTATGNLQMKGLPFVVAGNGVAAQARFGGAGLAWGAGPATSLGFRVVGTADYILAYGIKSATADVTLSIGNVVVGTVMALYLSGHYRI